MVLCLLEERHFWNVSLNLDDVELILCILCNMLVFYYPSCARRAWSIVFVSLHRLIQAFVCLMFLGLGPYVCLADVEEFYRQCDPGKKFLLKNLKAYPLVA